MPPPVEQNRHLNNSLRDYKGVNTQAYRTVIGDDQFSWLEGVMPIGFGNMVALYGPSASLAAWPSAIYLMRSVNINGTDYEIGFGTNGAIYAVNLGSFAVTTIAGVGTLSGAGSSICQWENAQAIIVDPTKGYFSWDGTTLTKWNGTIQSITITAIGTGYTSSPTIGGFGTGGGSGGSATAHIQVGLVTTTAAGTGYAPGDILTIVGGTAVRPAQIKVASVNAGTGALTGINLLDPGDYTAAPTNPASVTGGYGTGATFTLNFGIGPITLTSPGSGYTSAPTLTVTGGGGTGGAVTANLSVVPSGGTSVATYAGRVWVSSNRTIVFSAPNSFNDFTPAAAGGSFVVVDETLHSSITALLSANNFLYILGTSSVNVVGDVSIVSGSTVFSNTNISASIGTNQRYSLCPYYRGIWFATSYGIYATYGATTQKASDDLDGVYSLIDLTSPISSGTAVVNKILTLCFLVKYNDPDNGARPLLAIFFNKKWFFDTQRSDLTLIDSAIINGSPTLFGTNGTALYRMFSDSTSNHAQRIQTKLWDMGDPLVDKRALKFGLEVINPSIPQTVTGTVDTEQVGNTYPITLNPQNFITWINNSGVIVDWANNLGAEVDWLTSGYSFFKQDVQTAGKYIGVTLNGNSAGTTYSGIHLQYVKGVSW